MISRAYPEACRGVACEISSYWKNMLWERLVKGYKIEV